MSKVCKAGGDSVYASYKAQLKNSENSIISVEADGQLVAKKIYFLPWQNNDDPSIVCKTLEKFVSDAFDKAVQETFETIAFPAVGCGEFGCSSSLVAQSMIQKVHQKQQMHNIAVTFVIIPSRNDIYDDFQKQLCLLKPEAVLADSKKVSATVKKGVIEVEQGDITMQKVF